MLKIGKTEKGMVVSGVLRKAFFFLSEILVHILVLQVLLLPPEFIAHS